ncbi:MAG: glycyl-radical enzyme activating protein [Actinobacteria bacterium]|nr:glycyl-radical enzyme activating protein [Actinomycetota bacterium]
MEKGIITNIERSSTVDGPGIRTVLFLKGCPLHCLWCQNPETIKLYPEILWNSKICIGCSKCIDTCVKGAIKLVKGKLITDRNLCMKCGECVKVCPSGARSLAGKIVTTDEILTVLLKDKIFYDKSGGGVTISGGEPTLQDEFLNELLLALKYNNVHTALDTSGFARWEVLKKILENVDLVLYDLKQMDKQKLYEYTGCNLDFVLQNLQNIDESGISIWIRTPVITGYTQDEEGIINISRFIAKLKNVKRYELLKYNILALQKYEWMDTDYILKKMHPPSEAVMRKLKKLAESNGAGEVFYR